MSAAVLAPPGALPQPADSSLLLGHVCHRCGAVCTANHADDKRRIVDLENQVKLLTDKAAAAVDKLADYEDQLNSIRAQQAAPPATPPKDYPPETPLPPPSARPSRFPLLSTLGRSQPPTPLRPSTSHSQFSSADDAATPSRREHDLQAALAREQEARQRAEGRLEDMNTEIEDLSAQLFQQANEMVATERQARAKLEERVEMLERRDLEKRTRLERLEGALKRIERVKGLLAT